MKLPKSLQARKDLIALMMEAKGTRRTRAEAIKANEEKNTISGKKPPPGGAGAVR